jgi:hypothetical protein
MKTFRHSLLTGLLFLCTSVFSQNVGIGTLTPNKGMLQIVSAQNVSQFSASAGDNLPGISISSPLALSATLSFNLNYGNAFRFLSTGYGGNFSFSPTSGILSYTTTQTKGNVGDAAFFNNTNFYLDSNGYVGIGTSVPKARFHALNAVIGVSAITPATGYILSVGGKIICEEVKVQLNAAWPDYVFEPNYHLPPLEELEANVMLNKHLPGIPSAAEINNQQGYEMGDMQKKMLEKMEELYRYVFEVNRENKLLKEKIAALEKRVDQQ